MIEPDDSFRPFAFGGDMENSPEAFERSLTKKVISHIGRIARRMVPGPDADDVIQQSILNGLRNFSSFRGESRFSTWLSAVTKADCSGRAVYNIDGLPYAALHCYEGDSESMYQSKSNLPFM